MVFWCQQHCYEKEHSTEVLSCKSTEITDIVNGKKTKINCYETTFKETVFFPEGGGQPYDTGFVNNIAVLKVLRRKDEAVHYLEKPLEIGSNVYQIIDWQRRHDHMQQHSAQHLITALADHKYDCPTSSWNLGGKISSIELDSPELTLQQLTQLEEDVNAEIRKSVPVITKEYQPDDPELQKVRTRGLPDDVKGPVRVVTIEGVDSNMCCGTHVTNLADLQAIKLLYSEKGKAGKTILHFVAGNRVLKYMGECVNRERALNALLHSNADDHVRLVEKSKKDLKQCMKSLKDAFHDLAEEVVANFRQTSPQEKVFFHHRRDGNSDYLGAIVGAFNDEGILKILTCGEDSGPGILIIHGQQEKVNLISRRLCEILEGKGGGKSRFTAKVNKLSRREEAKQFVIETLKREKS